MRCIGKEYIGKEYIGKEGVGHARMGLGKENINATVITRYELLQH